MDPVTEMFAASTAPTRTAVAPVKAWPVMVTVVPGAPREGWKPSIEGVTAKLPALSTCPAGPTTVILPEVAEAGTTARSDVAERIVTELAMVSLKLTLVTLARFVPLTVTEVPMGPAAGVKLLIVGARITMKSAGLRGGARRRGHGDSARDGGRGHGRRDAVVGDNGEGQRATATAPNFTDVAPPNVAPARVTIVPGVACAGETETMRGATRKSVALVTGPAAGLTTARRPVVAPVGIVTRTEVARHHRHRTRAEAVDGDAGHARQVGPR